MQRYLKNILAIGLLVACLLGTSARNAQAQTQNSTAATAADYPKWKDQMKTWGQWGPDDQRGMSNLITPEKTLSAVRLVKDGIVVSLAHPVPQKADPEVAEGSVFQRTTNHITST